MQLLTSNKECTKQDRSKWDHQRVQLSQPGDNDPVVTVADGQTRLQPVMNSTYFCHSGHTGKRPRQCHYGQGLPGDVETCISGSSYLTANNPYLVSPGRFFQDKKEQQGTD